MKIEVGQKVTGKLGLGTISKIITKSTGYVEVTYDNGTVKKEMAFNLTSQNGENLKNKPESGSKLNPANFGAKSNYSNWTTDEKYAFELEREAAARNSKSW